MYLYCIYFQLLDVDPQELGEEDGANVDLDSQRKGKCAVIKTSTRQVCLFKAYFLFKLVNRCLAILKWPHNYLQTNNSVKKSKNLNIFFLYKAC